MIFLGGVARLTQLEPAVTFGTDLALSSLIELIGMPAMALWVAAATKPARTADTTRSSGGTSRLTTHPPTTTETHQENPMTTTLYTHVDIEIPRPAEQVWAVVTDYATDTVWRKGITEMTPDHDGPPHVGTNVREVLQLGGRQYVTDTTVTEVGPGMSYRFAGTGTSGVVRGRRSVTPATAPDTALFTYDVELEPHAIPRLARPLLRWWLQHSLRRDLRRLRTLVMTTP